MVCMEWIQCLASHVSDYAFLITRAESRTVTICLRTELILRDPHAARLRGPVTNDVILPLSLIVITRNEAAMIGQCLESVPFAAEKIVVDCGSTDATQELAAAHGAKVVHQNWLGFGPQRNFATTLASHDWKLLPMRTKH